MAIRHVGFCWSVGVLASLAAGAVLAGDRDPRAMVMLREASQKHAEDWERLRTSAGHGVLQWVSADGAYSWTCDLDFSLSSNKIHLELRTIQREIGDLRPRTFDELEMVCDGETICICRHSDRYKPNGCQLFVREDSPSQFLHMGVHGSIDLRRDLVPQQVRKEMGAGLEKHDAEVRLTGVSQVTVQFANQRWVYGIDPDAGARISTIEGFAATQTTPFSKTEYHYVEDGATFTPRQVVRSKTDPTSPGEYYTVSVYLSEIVGEVPDDSFGLDVLDVCDGARILDRRRDAETAVRSFSPSVAASQAAGSIAAQVAAMPVRRAGHNDTEVDIAVHSEHSGWRWYLIGANAVTIILVSAFWLISRRK